MPRKYSTTSKVKKAKKTNTEQVFPKPAASDEIFERFFQVVGDLRNEEESKTFLLDFLTDSERITFAKRLAIGLELQSGKSYEDVRKMYGVSSATISTVASMMKSAGMKLALRKVSTEKWADQMSHKFLKAFRVK
jgi:uncharacterized protein YerC